MTAPADEGISIRGIARASSKISGVNIVGGLLAVAANVLVARRLGPESLGVVGFVQLWLLYAGFVKPGFMQAAFIEMLHLHGQGKDVEARRVQDVALSAEAAFLVLPAAAIAGASFFFEGLTRAGILIGSLTFVVTSFYQLVDTVQWTHKRFALIARVTLLVRTLQPVLLIVGCYTAGVIGVLLAPIGAILAALAYYRWRTAATAASWVWDPPEARRLAAAGLPLVLNGLLYWSFRTSDRTMVAALLPIASLGYFTFAMSFINQGCQVVSDFLNVLQTSLFSELGRLGSARPLAPKVMRITLLILLLTGAAAGAAQTGFHPMVALFAPRFLPGVGAFDVLTLNLVAMMAPLLATGLLISTVVDRRHTANALQLGGLLLNLALGWTLATRGYGLEGIAWSSAVSQLAIAAGAFVVVHPYLFEGAPAAEPARFYGWCAALVGLTGALHFGMDCGPFAYAEGSPWTAPAAARLTLLAAVWGGAAALTRRVWWAEGQPLFKTTT